MKTTTAEPSRLQSTNYMLIYSYTRMLSMFTILNIEWWSVASLASKGASLTQYQVVTSLANSVRKTLPALSKQIFNSIKRLLP